MAATPGMISLANAPQYGAANLSAPAQVPALMVPLALFQVRRCGSLRESSRVSCGMMSALPAH
jgi:hypothetical protein